METPIFIEVNETPEVLDYMDKIKSEIMHISDLLDHLHALRFDENIQLSQVKKQIESMQSKIQNFEESAQLS